MSVVVIPIQAKAKVYATPTDMLRDLARLDATLVYRLDPDGPFIGFEAPRHTIGRFNATLSMLDRCDEAWQFRYFCTAMEILGIEDASVESPVGEERRLRLRTAFVEKVPETGADAFRLLMALNDEVGALQSDRPGSAWLSAVNRRNDLINLLQSMTGTTFGLEIAEEARRTVHDRGIDIGEMRS